MSQFKRAKKWAKEMKDKGYHLIFCKGSYLGREDEDFESFREIKAFGFTENDKNAIRTSDGRYLKRMATFRFYKFKNALQAV